MKKFPNSDVDYPVVARLDQHQDGGCHWNAHSIETREKLHALLFIFGGEHLSNRSLNSLCAITTNESYGSGTFPLAHLDEQIPADTFGPPYLPRSPDEVQSVFTFFGWLMGFHQSCDGFVAQGSGLATSS